MSPLKQQIRNVWAKDNPNMRGDDYVHINDNFYQTYEYTRLLFNKNSLKALHFQDLTTHMSKDFDKTLMGQTRLELLSHSTDSPSVTDFRFQFP